MSANGLPGKRDDAYRAGIIPINVVMEKIYHFSAAVRSSCFIFNIRIRSGGIYRNLPGSATTGRQYDRLT